MRWKFWVKDDNAWIDTDRRERRKTVLTALVFLLAVLSGIGALIYSLASS